MNTIDILNANLKLFAALNKIFIEIYKTYEPARLDEVGIEQRCIGCPIGMLPDKTMLFFNVIISILRGNNWIPPIGRHAMLTCICLRIDERLLAGCVKRECIVVKVSYI